ncbi:MAG: amino acid adenylation domain-containing protein [Candidatus Amoebophilus sp.]
MCRYLADGNIEYIGRLDNQIKLRGYRIELEEIEHALRQQAGVKEGVVVVKEIGGHRRLVAYVVGDDIDKPRIDCKLKEVLPSYMVPQLYEVVKALPLLINGKVDRKALEQLAMEGSVRRLAARVAPETEVEKLLADIWESLLGIEGISLEDNFFGLGGDSIVSIQVVARARQAGIMLSVRQIFETPILKDLATHIESTTYNTAQPTFATRVQPGQELPLTPIQHWFFNQNLKNTHYWNQAILLEANCSLEHRLVEGALIQLVEKHQALRLRFIPAAQGWSMVEQVEPLSSISVMTWNAYEVTGDTQEEAIYKKIKETQASLDITHGPIIQALIVEGTPQRLLLVIHHLVIDAVSWRLLLSDLSQVYAICQNQAPAYALPAVSSYGEWVLALQHYSKHSKELAEEKPYWLNIVREACVTLPSDMPGLSNTFQDAATISTSLDKKLTRQLLQGTFQAYRTQIIEVLLAALARAIYITHGIEKIYLHVEGHGREDIGMGLDPSSIIGWFTSLYPVLISLTPDMDEIGCLKAVKENLRTLPRKGIGYGVLRYMANDLEVREAEQPAISFNYLGQSTDSQQESCFTVLNERIPSCVAPENTRSHLIEINAMVVQEQLEIYWAYSTQHYHADTIVSLADAYINQLTAVIQACETSQGYTPSDFPLLQLTQEELDQLYTPQLEDLYPVSHLQSGLFFHDKSIERSKVDTTYIIQSCWEIRGLLHIGYLEQAWQQAVDDHAILRTGFYWSMAGQPIQMVSRQVTVPIIYEDLKAVACTHQQEAINQILQQARYQQFGLSQPPLLRLHILQLTESVYQLIITQHHIILDGWSGALLLSEIMQNYFRLHQGKPIRKSRSLPYKHYISWLSKQNLDEQKEFWQTYLGAITPHEHITSRLANASIRASQQPSYTTYEIKLSIPETDQIKALAKHTQMTLNAILQSAWCILLYKYLNQSTIRFGMTLSGRSIDLPGIENMVGMFINTLPFSIELKSDLIVQDLLELVQKYNTQIQAHSCIALTDIQRLLGIEKHIDLLDHLFVFENYPEETSALQQSSVIQVAHQRTIENTEYALTILLSCKDQLHVCFSYDQSRIDSRLILQVSQHYRLILMELFQHLGDSIRNIPMLSPAELNRLLNKPTHVADKLTVVQLFELQVERHPNAIAISYLDETITYDALNKRANQLAHYLQKNNVALEQIVAVAVDHPFNRTIAWLAVLKVGAAYLPLDTDVPYTYTAQILEDANKPLILTESNYFSTDLLYIGKRIDLDILAMELRTQPVTNLAQDITADNLAYVIYTSGTTGKPKGVMIEHKSIVRLVWQPNYIQITSSDVVAQTANIAFDAATFEVWGALLNGATLAVLTKKILLAPQQLKKTINQKNIGIMWLTSGLFNHLVALDPTLFESIRYLIVGGEVLNPVSIQKVLEHPTTAPKYLLNGYGPTECTTFATTYPIHRTTITENIPLGKPINKTNVYILDERHQPVPVGCLGEIYLAGEGLARGYWNDAALTKEKFVTLPTNIRAYRTGDLGSLTPDGILVYEGRKDQQVKIRGFRVEVAQIEIVLRCHPSVIQAAVVAEVFSDAQVKLIAYITCRQSDEDMPLQERKKELQAYLCNQLPSYMLPSIITILKELPLTINGKVDKKALTLQNPEQQEKDTPVLLESPLQQKLAMIWKDLLDISEVYLFDSFFELGGHSLLVLRLQAEIERQLGMSVSINELFQHKTIASLAQLLTTSVSSNSVSATKPCLTCIQKVTPGCPSLLLVHPVDGLSSCYMQLGGHLPSYNLYGFNDPYFGEVTSAFDSLPRMASFYIDNLLKQEIDAPYHLVGWSFGGVLAFEMAVQLSKRGYTVGHLILLDSYNFDAYPVDGEALLQENIMRLHQQQKEQQITFKNRQSLQIEMERNINWLLGYQPTFYPGHLTLIKATIQESNQTHVADNYNGWQSLSRSITVIPIRETHSRLFNPASIGLTASYIQQAYEAVFGK